MFLSMEQKEVFTHVQNYKEICRIEKKKYFINLINTVKQRFLNHDCLESKRMDKLTTTS